MRQVRARPQARVTRWRTAPRPRRRARPVPSAPAAPARARAPRRAPRHRARRRRRPVGPGGAAARHAGEHGVARRTTPDGRWARRDCAVRCSGVTGEACTDPGAIIPEPRARSSVDQSIGLRNRVSGVRIPPGAPMIASADARILPPAACSMPGMLDEALLLGIASVAAVIAGFAAVTAALTPPGGSWSQVHRIRQRAIVSTSFNVVFEALLPVIAFAWLVDVRQAMVVSSAVVALYALWVIVTRGRQLYRAGAMRTWGGRLLFAPGITATLLFASNALLFGSVAVFALALCVQLSVAVISFYQLVAAASG